MKNNIEKIKSIIWQCLKYISTFILTLVVLISLTTVVNKIPRNYLKNNYLKSIEKIEQKNTLQREISMSTVSDEVVDVLTLNIVYSMDNKHPLKSFLAAKFVCFYDLNISNLEALKRTVNENLLPNQEYLRYFHGSLLILKPLFCFLDLQGIYLFNFIIFCLLTIILLVQLWKRSKKLVGVVLISYLMTFMYVVPNTLEYTWNIFIMLIISILALKIEKKKEYLLPYLWIISGVMTCFFDFLTTETLTCLFPLSLVVLVRIDEKRLTSLKKGLMFVIKLVLLWFCSYAFTWVVKWQLASIVLKIDAMLFVSPVLIDRINGLVAENMFIQCKEAVLRNIFSLAPFCFLKKGQGVLLVILLIEMIILFIKKKEKSTIQLLLVLIGVIPLIRFILISNHSYLHYFFTYRALAVTIINILGILMYGRKIE